MSRYSKLWNLYVTVILYFATLTLGEQPKIVIVGAGSSGVAAASKLYENGFQDVTILEAENRIGGRVFTTRFDDSWVDVGGQWVNGQTNNIAFELAEPLGLVNVPKQENNILVYSSEGSEIPISISNDLFALFGNITNKALSNLVVNNGSVGDYYTSMIINEAAKLSTVNETTVKQFVRLFESIANLINAADSWFDSSTTEFLEYSPCPGNFRVNWKDRGYGTILDVLMKKIPNPENELPVRNNTKFNSEVVNIDHNSTDGEVLVELENGKKYTADHVIVTTSLGVLKERYETLFTPALPESKIKSIKGLAMGTVAKIYLSFEAPWWHENADIFSLLWTDTDIQEYKNDPDRRWALGFMAFSTVSHRPRLLCAWMSGPGARYMEELPEDQVLHQTVAILEKFLSKTYDNITRPMAILRSSWYNNKHFRGSNSYRSIKTEQAGVSAEQLASPLIVNDKPVVLFAGEATNPHHYRTVHGAIESGFREAYRLINFYNTTVQKL